MTVRLTTRQLVELRGACLLLRAEPNADVRLTTRQLVELRGACLLSRAEPNADALAACIDSCDAYADAPLLFATASLPVALFRTIARPRRRISS